MDHDCWHLEDDFVVHGEPKYGFKVSRLSELDWPSHLAEKSWVTPECLEIFKKLLQMSKV